MLGVKGGWQKNLPFHIWYVASLKKYWVILKWILWRNLLFFSPQKSLSSSYYLLTFCVWFSCLFYYSVYRKKYQRCQIERFDLYPLEGESSSTLVQLPSSSSPSFSRSGFQSGTQHGLHHCPVNPSPTSITNKVVYPISNLHKTQVLKHGSVQQTITEVCKEVLIFSLTCGILGGCLTYVLQRLIQLALPTSYLITHTRTLTFVRELKPYMWVALSIRALQKVSAQHLIVTSVIDGSLPFAE